MLEWLANCSMKDSARNNSQLLAIFRPISAFGWPKSILADQIFLYIFNGDSDQ